MDKRHKPLQPEELRALHESAVRDILMHPEWDLVQVIRHAKKTIKITTEELAAMADVGKRTLQDIEAGLSGGTVLTMNKVLGCLGLKLGVVELTPTKLHTPSMQVRDITAPAFPRKKAATAKRSATRTRTRELQR